MSHTASARPPSSSTNASSTNASPLSLPRILCLHGGGTNAEVLRLQARAFISHLAPHYRLVFADAPFLCDAHPAIVPVYEDLGPFRMWYRWRSEQPRCGGTINGDGKDGDEDRDDDEVIVAEMEYQLRSAMEQDEREGGTGRWVGLLGFSQGARVAGSILYDRELRLWDSRGSGGELTENAVELDVPGLAGGHWRFAILIAGQGPFLKLSELGEKSGMTSPPGVLPDFSGQPHRALDGGPNGAQKLGLPTLHVQGLRDNVRPRSRLWYEKQFVERQKDDESSSGGATVIEWDGDHRLPFTTKDMLPIAEAIVRIGV